MKFRNEFGDLSLWLVIGIITLISCLIVIPIAHLYTDMKIYEFKVISETINQSRDSDISALERATIQQIICEWNGWLAREQYTNSLAFFNWYVPDEVDDLEFIK